MKIFLDKIGFLIHRPHFFGKTFTSIVAQGVYRGEEIVKYFDFIGNGFGFNVLKVYFSRRRRYAPKPRNV